MLVHVQYYTIQLCAMYIHVHFLYKGSINALSLAAGSDIGGVGVTTSQFILTCISTGGPTTNVTWTRDSEIISDCDDTFSLTTELNDAVTAQYTHTLAVTGRLGGLYTCTVANEKPSEAVTDLFINGTCREIEKSKTSLHHIMITLSKMKRT